MLSSSIKTVSSISTANRLNELFTVCSWLVVLECTPRWSPTSKTLSRGSCVYECLALWHSLVFIAAHVLFISWRFINKGSVFSIITGAQFMVDMSWEDGFFKHKLRVLQSIPNLFLVGHHWVSRFFFLSLCVWSILAFFFFLVIVHRVKRRGALRDRRLREAGGHVVRAWAGCCVYGPSGIRMFQMPPMSDIVHLILQSPFYFITIHLYSMDANVSLSAGRLAHKFGLDWNISTTTITSVVLRLFI